MYRRHLVWKWMLLKQRLEMLVLPCNAMLSGWHLCQCTAVLARVWYILCVMVRWVVCSDQYMWLLKSWHKQRSCLCIPSAFTIQLLSSAQHNSNNISQRKQWRDCCKLLSFLPPFRALLQFLHTLTQVSYRAGMLH